MADKLYAVETYNEIKNQLPVGASESTIALLVLSQSLHESVIGDAGDLEVVLGHALNAGLTGNHIFGSHVLCHPVTVLDDTDYDEEEFDDDLI